MNVEFTWKPEKAKRNLAKHKVSFETAQQVFGDPYVIILEDCEAEGEVRYHVLGHAAAQLLLVVVFVDRSDHGREIIHIISARKAEAYEKSTYSDQF